MKDLVLRLMELFWIYTRTYPYNLQRSRIEPVIINNTARIKFTADNIRSILHEAPYLDVIKLNWSYTHQL